MPSTSWARHPGLSAAAAAAQVADLRALVDRGPLHSDLAGRSDEAGYLVPVSYTHLTLPTNREV